MHPPRPKIELQFLHSMLSLATISAAVEVSHGIRQRRSGIDASEQEEAPLAKRYLSDSIVDLRELLVRIRLVTICVPSEADGAHLVRMFDREMLRQRCASLLHTIHQRLLSLYPYVSEETVEQARVLTETFAADDAPTTDPEIHRVIDAALELCRDIEAYLKA